VLKPSYRLYLREGKLINYIFEHLVGKYLVFYLFIFAHSMINKNYIIQGTGMQNTKAVVYLVFYKLNSYICMYVF